MYSGFDLMNQGFARRDCFADETLYLITDTVAGRALDLVQKLNSLDDEQRLQVWREASMRFAENTQGDVQTNVIDARSGWVFRNVELPALLANEAVTSINGISIEHLRLLKDDKTIDFELAYEKVCSAELARDRQHAVTLGSAELQTRTEWKAQALHLQQYREIEHQQDQQRQTEEVYYRMLAQEQKQEHRR